MDEVKKRMAKQQQNGTKTEHVQNGKKIKRHRISEKNKMSFFLSDGIFKKKVFAAAKRSLLRYPF